MNRCNSNQLLSALIHGNSTDDLTLSQWSNLIKVARHSGVLAKLAIQQQSVEQTLPLQVNNCFLSACNHFDFFSRQVKREINELSGNARDVNISEVILLKGAAYNAAGIEAGKGRFFSDIDVLIDKSSIPPLEKRLNLLGWFAVPMDKYDERYYRQWSHEIPPLRHVKRKVVLDIHHNLVPLISNRAPDITLFTQGKISLYDNVYILRPAAMVLHSAIHLFTGEEFDSGYRDASDITQLFDQYGSNAEFWRDLETLARQSGFTTELYLAASAVLSHFKPKYADKLNELVAVYSPGKYKSRYLVWLYSTLLLPKGNSQKLKNAWLAKWLGFLRGHYLKMPLPVLVWHTCHKIFTSGVETISGKKNYRYK